MSHVADDTPRGWTTQPLTDIAGVIMGQSPPGSTYNTKGDGLPFFQGKSEFGEDSPTPVKWCTAPTRVAEPGDLLMSVRAPVGPTNIADQRCAIGRGLAIIRPQAGVPVNLVRHAIRLHEDEIASWGTGTTFTAINKGHFKDILVSLPAEPERQGLASLLDQTIVLRRSSTDHVSAARRAIERFRQAVLAAACSGRLTVDWRKAQLDVDTDGDLPAGWRIVELQQLAADGAPIRYGIVKPGPEVAGGVPYVRQQDVKGGAVLVDQLAHTSAEIADRYRRSALREGDVLLGIIRNLRVAIVPPGLDGANITQGMVRIRPRPGVEGEYLKLFLESPAAQRWMHDRYVGLAMPRINVQDARVIPVALPPEEEQPEIVKRATEILSAAQGVATRVVRAASDIDRTAQAVLAKAFRGELLAEARDISVQSWRPC